MPARERQQISFLPYSHFIQVNYLWIAFVITFISCMIKFSHLINIAMALWRLRYLNCFNMLFLLLRPFRNSSVKLRPFNGYSHAWMTPRASKSACEQTNYSASIFLGLRTEHILKPINLTTYYHKIIRFIRSFVQSVAPRIRTEII